MERDFAAELAAIRLEIQVAQQEVGKYNAQKEALGNQKSEIKAICQRLDVIASLANVQAKIESTQKELSALLSELDKDLRRS